MSVGQHAELQELVNATKERLASIERQTVPSTGDKFERVLTEAVYGAIFAVTVSAWAVIGFVIWLPLLVRATVLLAATVFYVTLFRDYARQAQAQARLHFAVRFFARGFDHFFAFYRQRHQPESPVGLLEPVMAMTRNELLLEGAWVASIWVVTGLSANQAASSLFGG